MTTSSHTRRDVSLLRKVPDVTLSFWIVKILATTVGETAADFLSDTLNLGLTITSGIMTVLLVITLVTQIRGRAYVPWIYWLSVVLISVVGTLISDNLVDNLGVPLEATTIGFSIALSVTFAAWYASEHTLSIHTIFTRRRELYYWAAILFTFALGTSAGDLTAESLKLGYWESALMFGAFIALVAAAYYRLHANAVLAFWIAYILTRPLGASCGDFLSQSTADGGLGLGTVITSAVFLGIIVALVVYFTMERRQPVPVSERIPH